MCQCVNVTTWLVKGSPYVTDGDSVSDSWEIIHSLSAKFKRCIFVFKVMEGGGADIQLYKPYSYFTIAHVTRSAMPNRKKKVSVSVIFLCVLYLSIYLQKIHQLTAQFLVAKCPVISDQVSLIDKSNVFYDNWLRNCGFLVNDKTAREYLFRSYRRNTKSSRTLIRNKCLE